jgi:hypothetical protein
MSTINPIWTGVGLNRSLHGERPAINGQSHGTANMEVLSLNVPKGTKKKHETSSGRDLNQEPSEHRSIAPLEQGCTNFTKNCEPSQNSMRQMGDVKQAACRRPTSIRQHHTKFIRRATRLPGFVYPCRRK